MSSNAATISSNVITFGSGNYDRVEAADNIASNHITFGSGDNDEIFAQTGNISNDVVSFGNGTYDMLTAGGAISSDTITFGNGAGDYLTSDSDGGSNRISFGNGNDDLAVLTGSSQGGDYFATGTGSGDTVSVGAHTKADIFAFALGTNGTNFTTVSGAAAHDQVEVNGGELGSKLVSASTGDDTLSSFISSLGKLTKGDTYVGFNTAANDTFVVTDPQSGQTGAIELTGVFQHSTLANHVLTLLA